MKKLYNKAVWLCIIFILCQCQRAPFQPETIRQDYLTFGQGGGMTNLVDTYYILADGHVYQHNNLTKEYQYLGRLKQNVRSVCLERARNLPASLFGCNEPGNIYYFLSIHAQDTVKSCTWGNRNFTPPEAITSFYQYTQQLVNVLSP